NLYLHPLSIHFSLFFILPFFFFSSYGHHRHLHSFPTRRSSDLVSHGRRRHCRAPRDPAARTVRGHRARPRRATSPPRDGARIRRSEEHTSELQSRGHLVCRLLLEKKKKIKRSRLVITRLTHIHAPPTAYLLFWSPAICTRTCRTPWCLLRRITLNKERSSTRIRG